MNQDEASRSQERVRVLASAVALPLDDERLPALANAFDAALKMIDQLDALGIAGSEHIAVPYDPAWPGAVERQR